MQMLEQLRFDGLDSVAVGAKALVADDQRQRHRVDAEDQRPFLGDDVEQSVDPVGLHRGDYRAVDRGHRARMAAGESDQVLVGFLDRAEPLAQVRDRPLFEGDDRGHRREDTPRAVNFLLSPSEGTSAHKKKAAAPFGTAAPMLLERLALRACSKRY